MSNKTPDVTINVTNNNYRAATPQLGISYIVTTTEKGDPNSPDVLIRTFKQFNDLYGRQYSKSTLNDIGSVKQALEMGSTLRISKVNKPESGDFVISDIKAAIDAFDDYDEAYQMVIDLGYPGISDDLIKQAYAYAFEKIKSMDRMLFIWLNGTDVEELTEETTAINTASGNSEKVALFAMTIKVYDPTTPELSWANGIGTVLGLADKSAVEYGPWYSFAGQNRGIASNVKGLSVNYGTPSKKTELNELAAINVNLFVIKPTRTQGSQVMLWHNFTNLAGESGKDNSQKFISTERLILYIKKWLRPFLESFLEEPNTFETWSRIYYQVKGDLIEDLVNRNAITNPEWLGDQDAKSYDDLSVNNEADVRNGIYHAIFKFKDVVSLQTIVMDVEIDTTNQTSSVSVASYSINNTPSPANHTLDEEDNN